jgi:hypothetical protein
MAADNPLTIPTIFQVWCGRMNKPTNSQYGWDRIQWQKATKFPPNSHCWGGGWGLLYLVHKFIIACQLTFVKGITVCLYLLNNPTSLHSYIHLAVSLHFRAYRYYIFQYCSQFLSYYIVLQFWLSTILIITMGDVICNWHIEQKCQQINSVSRSADCSVVLW